MTDTPTIDPSRLGPIETVKIDSIIPYHSNPREISGEAVEAVAESIKRYGFVQPIVVDRAGVIVVGHTRHRALKSLGHETCLVTVMTDATPEEVRSYRLADNRLGEMTSWDTAALALELRTFEDDLVADFFPEIDLEVGTPEDFETITDKDLEKAEEEVFKTANPQLAVTAKVTCPSCEGVFEIEKASLPGLSRGEVDEIRKQARSS